MKMEVDQFAKGHLDVPLASGVVAVAARVTHRGHGASCAAQDLWTATARCYTGRTGGENKQKQFFVPYLVFEQSGSV